MPPWPIAMPSSTAIVLNSRGIAAGRLDRLGDDPADRREVGVAGHELGEAVGDRDDRLADVLAGYPGGAQERARPAMLRPWVTVRDLSGGMGISWIRRENR